MSRYDVDKFVPLPDQELICCICTNVLDEPVESPCRHVFCKICIETWLNNKTTCPTCRDMVMKTDLKPVLPLVRNMLNKLTLMCDFMDNGCNDLISLEKYPAHINTCDYEWVLCRHPKCVKTMLRKLIKQHEEEECLCREVVCGKKCGLRIPIEEVAEHDCVAKLKEVCEARNRETEQLKTELIGLRDTFEKLKQEVKSLKKEVSRQRHSSWDSSSTSSRNSDYSIIRLRSRSPRSSTSRSRSPSRSLSRSPVHRIPLISRSTDSSGSEDSSPAARQERAEQEVIPHRIVAIDYAENPTATRSRTTSSPLTNEQDIATILYMCERCHEYEQNCNCSRFSYSYHSDLTNFSRSFSADDSDRGRQFSSEDNHSESEAHDTSINYESRNMPASTTLLSGTEDGPSTINTYSQAGLSHDAITDDSSDDVFSTHIVRVKHNPSPDVGYSPTPITPPVLKKRHSKKYCRYSPTQISPGPSYSPSHPCRPMTLRFSSHSAEVIETTPDKSSPSYSPTRIVQCECAQNSEEDEAYNPSSHLPAHSEVNYSPAFLKRQRENGKKRKFSKKTSSACWSSTDSDSSCNETNTKRYKPTPKSILCQIKIAQTSENGKLGTGPSSDIASSSSYQTPQSSKTLSDSQDNETLLELQEEILALRESDLSPSESSAGNKQDNTTQSKDSQM